MLRKKYESWKKVIDEINALDELISLYSSQEDDEITKEIENDIEKLSILYQPLKNQLLLSEKYDENNCYLSIHSGAGGTEASDWAGMLMRMYLRYAERNNFKTEIQDIEENEGGIKSCTILVKGDYAYGYLKGEAGVHRLVRISPFDANKRRHTSFSSVYISPVVEDDIQISLKPEDYRCPLLEQ